MSDEKYFEYFRKVPMAKAYLNSGFAKVENQSELYRSGHVVDLVLEVMLNESKHFMPDLVDSDDQFQDNRNHHGILPTNDHVSGSDELPIAELLLASHASLLLHTLMFRKLIREEIIGTDDYDRSYRRSAKQSRNDFYKNFPVASDIAYYICSKLPRKSFWLMIRLLKAYIALQGQVGPDL